MDIFLFSVCSVLNEIGQTEARRTGFRRHDAARNSAPADHGGLAETDCADADDRRSARRFRIADLPEQLFGGNPGTLLRQTDRRGQRRRVRNSAEYQAAAADDRKLLGNRESELLGRGDDSDRHPVVSGENRGGAVAAAEDLVTDLHAVFVLEVRNVEIVRRVRNEVVIAHRIQESGFLLRGEFAVGRAGHAGDPPVTEIEQMRGRNHRALAVVVNHHIEVFLAVALGIEAPISTTGMFRF